MYLLQIFFKQKFWQNVIVQFFSYLNQYMWDVNQTTMMNILKSKI